MSLLLNNCITNTSIVFDRTIVSDRTSLKLAFESGFEEKSKVYHVLSIDGPLIAVQLSPSEQRVSMFLSADGPYHLSTRSDKLLQTKSLNSIAIQQEAN